MNLISIFRNFYKSGIATNLTTSELGLFHALLYKANELRYRPKIEISNTELQSLSGLNASALCHTRQKLSAFRFENDQNQWLVKYSAGTTKRCGSYEINWKLLMDIVELEQQSDNTQTTAKQYLDNTQTTTIPQNDKGVVEVLSGDCQKYPQNQNNHIQYNTKQNNTNNTIPNTKNEESSLSTDYNNASSGILSSKVYDVDGVKSRIENMKRFLSDPNIRMNGNIKEYIEKYGFDKVYSCFVWWRHDIMQGKDKNWNNHIGMFISRIRDSELQDDYLYLYDFDFEEECIVKKEMEVTNAQHTGTTDTELEHGHESRR